MRLIKYFLIFQLIISLNSCGPLAYKKVEIKPKPKPKPTGPNAELIEAQKEALKEKELTMVA